MLHSDWLIAMMEKSAATPAARMLALFDILGNWLQAPGIRPGLIAEDAYAGSPEPLLAYLARQAAAAGAREPEALAHQVYCIAAGALHSELAGGGALASARHAAAVLLRAHAKPGRRAKACAVAASAACLALAAALAMPFGETAQPAARTAAATPQPDRAAVARVAARQTYSPDQVATLHHVLERIRQGDCQYPQALMLAPEQRAVLLENVVNGAIPAEAGQMRDAQLLAQKVECYYPPVAMTAM